MNDPKRPIIVNGREYPMWSQFVQRQAEWIGAVMEDFGNSVDQGFGLKPKTTRIISIELNPNGTKSALFLIRGESFNCGFDVRVGGVTGGEDGWITFSGYGNHKWRIKNPNNKN